MLATARYIIFHILGSLNTNEEAKLQEHNTMETQDPPSTSSITGMADSSQVQKG